MYKKLLAVLITSVFLIAFSHQAQAFVEGEWDMYVIEKVSAKVKNVATAKYTDDFSDTWSFETDGQFTINGITLGTWGIVGNNFAVYLDESLVGVILANNLQDAGFPGDTVVTITSTKASGTMKKDGSIKGTYKIVAVITTSAGTGKLTVNAKFTGIKIADNPPDDGTTFTMSEYFPLGQGDTWTYREDDDDLTVKTISGTEKINSIDAAKIIDEDGDYYLWTNNDGLAWHKEYDADDVPGCGWEQFNFNPPIIASGAIVSIGSTYASTSTVSKTDCTGGSATLTVSYVFSIEGIDSVTVPAGTFNNCLRLKGILTVNGSTETNEMTIWLAKGVGKVKSISISTQNGVAVETWTDDLVSAVVSGVSYH
ncbi:MAG: hypothetical protein RDU01_08960 [Thermodesulfovibrionales bacterium]|nr:hypothetical protein [Thermodesulfovibrionales bacterium]